MRKNKLKRSAVCFVLLLSLILTSVSLCVSVSAETAQTPQIRGDMNGDGKVDTTDAIYLLRHIMFQDKYPIKQSGDMNGDGETNTADAIYLLRHVMLPDKYPLSDVSVSRELKYELAGDKLSYIVVGVGSCTDANIIIPSTHNGLPVTAIGNMAFYNCSFLESVVIPDSVTSIGQSAFYNSKKLRSITVSDNIVRINNYAFAGTAYYNDSANWTQNALFVGNHLIEVDTSASGDYVIPDGTKCIADHAFSGRSRIKSVTIPASVSSIGKDSFKSCSGLRGVYISDLTKWCEIKFESIETNPLNYAKNLYLNGVLVSELVIPDGVTDIGSWTFCNGTSIKSIVLPDSVLHIGEDAFVGTAYYEKSTNWTGGNALYIGNHLIRVKDTASGDFTVRENTLDIADGAFAACSKIRSVTFQEGLRAVGAGAFTGCTTLRYVYISDLADWCSISFAGAESNPLHFSKTLYLNRTRLINAVIPDSVTSIGDWQFDGWTELRSVTIPSSVTSIGDSAFLGCTGISEITLPRGLTAIGDYAFSGCTALRKLAVPGSVTSIGNYAFGDCRTLTTINYDDIPRLWSAMTKGVNWDMNAGIGTTAKKYTVVFDPAVSEGLEYTIDTDKKGYTVSGIGSAAATDIVIPAKYNDLPVRKIADGAFAGRAKLKSVFIFDGGVSEIGKSAFEGCDGLEEITLGGSVKSIGDSAFAGCTKLDGVVLASGVTAIGNSAFAGCAALSGISIPDSVSKIGDSAFEGCAALETVTLGKGVKSIGKKAFYENKKLSAINIPNGTLSIGDSAFAGCESLGTVSIPDSVTDLGSAVFEHCTGLTSATIGRSVKSIGDRAFYGCYGLSTVSLGSAITGIGNRAFYGCVRMSAIKIPDKAESIGNEAFRGCLGLETLSLGSGVKRIGESAFEGCEMLASITIPNAVTTVGNRAFRGCARATTISIGSGVTSIGAEAFANCPSVIGISVGMNNKYFSASGYCLIEKSSKTLVLGCKNSIIPTNGSVSAIGYGAFMGCTGLTEITIPGTVTKIGGYAFAGCTGLDEVIIPGTVEYIDGHAFEGCSGLTRVAFGSGLRSIGECAFLDCSGIAGIKFPDSLESIGESAFGNCGGLSSVKLGAKLDSIGEKAFYGCDELYVITNNSKLTLTIGGTDNGYVAYRAKLIINADGSRTYASDGSEYTLTDDGFLFERTAAGYRLIAYTGALEAVTLPKDIDGSTYEIYRMRGVKSVIIPNGITSIGDSAFAGCEGLSSIVIPASVTRIGDRAFENCSGLMNVAIPNNTVSVGDNAFYGCESLKVVSFGIGVTHIGDNAFIGCNSLETIMVASGNTVYSSAGNCLIEKSSQRLLLGCKNTIIPTDGSVTSIADSAFSGCVGLEKLSIPEGVTSIGRYAFTGCTSLKSISIPKSVNNIGYRAFCECGRLESISVDAENKTYLSSGNCLIEKATKTLILGCSSSVIPTDGSVTDIGDYAFFGCGTLESITIPDCIRSIGDGAFAACTGLGSVVLPGSVRSLGDDVFRGCTGLASVEIAEGVERIGDNMFNGCTSLVSISIPGSVSEIGEYAFAGCTALERLTLPESVRRILRGAFSGDTRLSETDLAGVTEIGRDAFANCTGLSSITLPKNLKSIGDGAFGGCEGLLVVRNNSSLKLTAGNSDNGGVAYYAKVIINADGSRSFVADGKTYILTNDGFLFVSESGRYILTAYTGGDESVTLPSDINGSAYVIYRMRGVKNVIIPDGITSVDAEAFYGCTTLTGITLGKDVGSIGRNAFWGCDALESISVAAGNKTFHSKDNCIIETKSKCLVVGCKSSVIPNDTSVSEIGEYAFAGCNGLTSVTIPTNVTKIGAGAFADCRGLMSIVLSSGAESVDSTAFDYSAYYHTASNWKNDALLIGDYLISVRSSIAGEYTVPDGVRYIADGAFAWCGGLESVTLPDSVIRIGARAFASCTELTTVKLGKGLQRIGQSAFEGCVKLGKITLPDSVLSIGDSAFKYCTGMTSILIGKSVSSIGKEAFSGCLKLTNITYTSNKTMWGRITKGDDWNANTGAYTVYCTDGNVAK